MDSSRITVHRQTSRLATGEPSRRCLDNQFLACGLSAIEFEVLAEASRVVLGDAAMRSQLTPPKLRVESVPRLPSHGGCITPSAGGEGGGGTLVRLLRRG